MAQKYLEKELESYFEKKLDELNIFHIKGESHGRKGYPDRTIFAFAELHVELKVGKEGKSYYKQTKIQKKWQNRIERSNGKYYLLEGYEQVDKFLALLRARKALDGDEWCGGLDD